MINFKQQELIQDFFQALKKNFPEIELMNVTESPEDPNDLWVNVTAPTDEDREIALIEMAGNKTADMLLDYGYYILVMPCHSRTSTLTPRSVTKKRRKQHLKKSHQPVPVRSESLQEVI